jgi:hypothetical protein
MQAETKEPWFQLCHLAVVEQDTAKVAVLVTEIERLLEERKSLVGRTAGLKKTTTTDPSSGTDR